MGGNPVLTSTGSVRNQNADGSQSRLGLLGVVNSGLLPTPESSLADHGGPNKRDSSGRMGLQFQAMALLPTPDTNNHRDGSKLRADNNLAEGGRHGISLHHLAAHGLLSTPQATDWKGGSGRAYKNEAIDLPMQVKLAMLPTPRAAEYKGTGPKGSKSNNHRLDRDYLDAVITDAVGEVGETCQLSHCFVMEMMGFPPNWVEAAFTKEPTEAIIPFEYFPQEYPTVTAGHKEDLKARLSEAVNPATQKPLTAGKLNKEGLRMGGNAIVPPVAFEIFKALESTWTT